MELQISLDTDEIRYPWQGILKDIYMPIEEAIDLGPDSSASSDIGNQSIIAIEIDRRIFLGEPA